jgi:hypothetical protein
MTQTPGPDGQGPLLELMGKIGIQLGTVAKRLDDDWCHKKELNASILPLKVELTSVQASATIDLPNNLGPRTGWYWDIGTMICQNLAGSAAAVAVYTNSANGVQVANFTASGQLNWGKKQMYLAAGERFVFVGNGSITGSAIISFWGTQVAAPYWGDYAL